MATIGTALTVPEATWQRYDDGSNAFAYGGLGWGIEYNSAYYAGRRIGCANTSNGQTVTFKFYGTKMRIIASLYTSYSSSIQVVVDGTILGTFSEAGSSLNMAFVYEKLGLTLGTHTVVLTKLVQGAYSTDFYFDAIDIDDTGYIVHNTTLTARTTVASMNIGDCIPCRYTALTSGVVGTFSELGTCTMGEIPTTGTATPDGMFYLIKTDKGTLVADRNIQTGISWDAINVAGMIEGTLNGIGIPINTSNIFLANTYPSYSVASTLTDGIANTCIVSNSTFTSGQKDNSTVVVIDLASIVPIGRIWCSLYADVANQYSTSVDIYISNDGVTYTLLGTALNSVNLDVNISTRFIKLTGFIINSTYVRSSLNEIKLFRPLLIRSLSGGCAYADANGNLITYGSTYGAFPTTNEWDKYIVKSNLGGKINIGDDGVWHWNTGFSSWCRDTIILINGNNKNRISRGLNTSNVPTLNGLTYTTTDYAGIYGFRPVLNYLETTAKATTMFY